MVVSQFEKASQCRLARRHAIWWHAMANFVERRLHLRGGGEVIVRFSQPDKLAMTIVANTRLTGRIASADFLGAA
jgi:hypothetical protein